MLKKIYVEEESAYFVNTIKKMFNIIHVLYEIYETKSNNKTHLNKRNI